jgi:hypothetical protein
MYSRSMSLLKRFYKSIWFFPVILAVPVVIFTSLQISGTSLGVLNTLFYGDQHDSSLVAGTPRPIRSDEWLVNTQTIISQAKLGYPQFNPRIGNGENMSLDPGIPYKNWSEIFRPQNLIYFVLPLANAFAFQWWILGYLLITSCYFFILTLAPRKRLIAVSLSLALFFSGVVQWWYEYSTLACLYYPLFIATAVMCLTRQKQRIHKILLCIAITYLMACFALLLYPPFQVVCGLALVAFLAGYFWKSYAEWGRHKTLLIIGSLAVCGICALVVVGLFVITRSNVIAALGQTSYPGRRSSSSGGFNLIHLLSSQLGYQFTSATDAAQYQIGIVTNQSEASNFLLLTPLLFIPNLILIYKDWRKQRHIDPLLVTLTSCFILFMLHLFVPAFSPIAKVFLLGEVPTSRLLVGMGLLNVFMFVALVLRGDTLNKDYWFPKKFSMFYALAVLLLDLVIDIHVHETSGTFVGIYRAVAFSLPLPIIMYLLLRRRFLGAAILYFAFTFFISFQVNPLYRGLGIVTKNPISQAMVRTNGDSDKRWIVDSVTVESLAIANGLHSLSGVYYYPQKSLWSSVPNAQYTSYNRYAHVTFGFFASSTAKPQLELAAQDQFRVTTGICSSYLKKEDVGFVLTSQKLNGACISKTTSVSTQTTSFYIYTLHW